MELTLIYLQNYEINIILMCKCFLPFFVFFFVSCGGSFADSLTRLGKRALNFLLSFTCNYVVYVGFIFSLGAWDRLRYFIVALLANKAMPGTSFF